GPGSGPQPASSQPTIHGMAGLPLQKRLPQRCAACYPTRAGSAPRPRLQVDMGKAMLQDNLFQKIIDRQIPAAIVYEDDQCLAFKDVNPQAPVHVLVIPRKVIATHADIKEEDAALLGHLHLVAARLANDLGIADGYRLVL